jgi:conjugative transfer signal peptidase TraF
MTRYRWLGCTIVGVAAMLAAIAVKPCPWLVYNASDSAPRGFYVVSPATDLHVGDYVIARLPDEIAALAAERGYLPRSVPVLKRIAALAKQAVCLKDGVIYIDKTVVARALATDGNGRPLAPWSGCRHLILGELFLLNAGNPASFDSRYFGPIDASYVRGKALLW